MVNVVLRDVVIGMPEDSLQGLLSASLSRKYEYLRDKMESEILPFMGGQVPFFPDHGIGHSQRIIENLNKMLSASDFQGVSELDAYALLVSAYVHDIGLMVSPANGTILDPMQVRSRHHELSGEYIRENYQTLGIDSANVAAFIEIICRTHRRQIDVEQRLEEDYPLADTNVHPRFASSVFRLADALDTDHRRAPEATSDYVMSLPDENKRHWAACQLISGFDVRDGVIFVRAHSTGDDDDNLLKWKTAELYDELWRVKDILAFHSLPIADVECNVQDASGESRALMGKILFQEFSKREIEAVLTLKALEDLTQ